MNQHKKLLTPKEGLIVRDPKTGIALPPEGKELVVDSYWKRRIKDGDIAVSEIVKKKKADLKVVKNKDNDNKD
tara:strand:+ start:263 stop:481 length:219 start_codon:yes stop_codon:yes gene_type:complete